MDREVWVVAGVRTPFARAGTALSSVPAVELARIAAREVVERAEADPGEIDEIVLGTAHGAAGRLDPARAIAALAKLPARVPALTVSRADASGLDCLVEAARRIRAQECDLILAVAAESGSAGVARTSSDEPGSVPTPAEAGERAAREFAVDREAQDRFALRSHQRAAASREDGSLSDEIVPVPIAPEYRTRVEADGGVRLDVTFDALTRLAPIFDREYGTVTEGNSARPADGAVAALLASGRLCAARGWTPLGRIASWSFAGCDPRYAGLAPVLATPNALRRAGGWTIGALDRVEIHESSAAHVLACARAFASRSFAERHLRSGPVGDLDLERVNVRGGAIALGHPTGASGARMVLSMLLDLRRSGLRRGLAALTAAGGQGAALAVEAGT